jgi:60 kDa SS-A/Ro ribonucleoprotein
VATRTKFDAVVIISDNESWAGRNNTHEEWARLKANSPKAKLVLLDLTPNHTSPVQTDKNVLNVGGFSDEVFTVINRFLTGDGKDVVKTINEVSLND